MSKETQLSFRGPLGFLIPRTPFGMTYGDKYVMLKSAEASRQPSQTNKFLSRACAELAEVSAEASQISCQQACSLARARLVRVDYFVNRAKE